MPKMPDLNSDHGFMEVAMEEAKKSKGKADDPKVGAVLVKNGQLVDVAHRGEKDHAEFTLLHKKIRSVEVTNGATLYTTLEPCTDRGHEKLPCADWVVKKKIARVVNWNSGSKSHHLWERLLEACR